MTDHFSDHATNHARNMSAINMMRKMVRDALLFPPPLQVYFPLIEVLTCRFLLGLSIRETAVQLGLTEGNVKAVQHRALKRAAALDEG